jgi:hypothetical protein
MQVTDTTTQCSERLQFFDPTAFLANPGVGRTIRRYKRKQAVFSQGDPADAVFYIQEWRVRLSVLSKQGKEATIALLGPGEFLGEGCIASDQPVRLATLRRGIFCKSFCRSQRRKTDWWGELIGVSSFHSKFLPRQTPHLSWGGGP